MCCVVNGWSVDAQCRIDERADVACDAQLKPCSDYCTDKYGAGVVAHCVTKPLKSNLFCVCIKCSN